MSTGSGIKINFSRQHPDIFLLPIIPLFIRKQAYSAHLYEWHEECFDDPAVKLLHKDTRRFIVEGKAKFDVIILDLPNLI
jgi:predicted membrane-bound spermidine synthase